MGKNKMGKEFKCSLCGKVREDKEKSFCDKCDEKEYNEETGEYE